ncbi:MAG: ABC transporter ATP-binding protein [Candidatus Bipolaricaulota bacterium]|nr:ABC transporter ATP-binding protein [Candidatus Bipolaricaulota bacterium]
MLLQVDNVSVAYGAVEALKGVSLSVSGAEIVAVLGANGAGKTTLLKAISGLVPVKSGAILYEGRKLHELPLHLIARMGVVHIPEGRRVFATLTVEENLNLGGYGCPKEEVQKAKEWVFQLFPILRERRRQLAGTLSGGEQQMLAIGRGLMRSPKLMLLDEPSLGLAPLLVDQVFATIVQINKDGVPILIVEQNARKALSIADQAHILEVGRVVLSGPARDLAADPRVREAYLGGATYERRRRAKESRATG